MSTNSDTRNMLKDVFCTVMGLLLGLALLELLCRTLTLGLGGLLLGVIEALAAGYIAIAWKDAIAFTVLILILIIRPTGILGERTADKL